MVNRERPTVSALKGNGQEKTQAQSDSVVCHG